MVANTSANVFNRAVRAASRYFFWIEQGEVACGGALVQQPADEPLSRSAAVRARLGGLDILVSNAGIEHFASLVQITPAEFDRVIATNTRGPLFAAKHAASHLGDGGRILLTSSVCAANNAAAEGSLRRTRRTQHHHQRDRAQRHEDRHVRHPGTPLPAPLRLDTQTQLHTFAALGRPAQRSEIAAAIAFLVRPTPATSPAPRSRSTEDSSAPVLDALETQRRATPGADGVAGCAGQARGGARPVSDVGGDASARSVAGPFPGWPSTVWVSVRRWWSACQFDACPLGSARPGIGA